MLSICVPVYNYDVTTLISALSIQSDQCENLVEIIVADDGSDEDFLEINKKIETEHNVRFIELGKNIGRSAIRNFLAKKARYNYILFLDCDSELGDNFIKKYLEAINNDSQVICGGTLHPAHCPSPAQTLRWKSGRKREDNTAHSRKQNKYKSFTSNNFVVKKEVFNKISFDEKIKKYGHEDTLFGIQLEVNKINIAHIDNPAIHIGIDTNQEYIIKTKNAIENLVQLLSTSEHKNLLLQRITLLNYYKQIDKLRLSGLVKIIFGVTEPLLIKNLTSKKPSLLLFDFFKMGYLVSLY